MEQMCNVFQVRNLERRSENNLCIEEESFSKFSGAMIFKSGIRH